MRAYPSLQRVLLESTPQYLENSHACVILGPDNLGAFLSFEGAGALEPDPPEFESPLSCFLVVQPEANKPLSSS